MSQKKVVVCSASATLTPDPPPPTSAQCPFLNWTVNAVLISSPSCSSVSSRDLPARLVSSLLHSSSGGSSWILSSFTFYNRVFVCSADKCSGHPLSGAAGSRKWWHSLQVGAGTGSGPSTRHSVHTWAHSSLYLRLLCLCPNLFIVLKVDIDFSCKIRRQNDLPGRLAASSSPTRQMLANAVTRLPFESLLLAFTPCVSSFHQSCAIELFY